MSTTSQSGHFLTILEQHKAILYKIANCYSHNSDDRNDLIQEMILQLWKSFGRYDSRYKYSTWIYRIALNVAISNIRMEKRRKAVQTPTSDVIIQLLDNEYNKDREEELDQLQRLISELKPLDKALVLLYLEEKSHKEIASITGISESNVATKIGRIKMQLKQKFLTR